MHDSALSMAMVGVVLALFVGAAVWLLYLGLKARRDAAATFAANARLEALVGSAPALAMIVRADGRLELPDRLADWLGLSPPPRYLDDLAGRDGGLTPKMRARSPPMWPRRKRQGGPSRGRSARAVLHAR